MIVKQVIHLSTVDLIHGNRDSEVSLILLEVSNTSLEQIMYGKLLKTQHCVGLARTCLPIGKHSHDALIKGQVKDGSDREMVKFLSGLLLGEGVVELELRIVDKLRYTIHFVFTLMNCDEGVEY